MRTQDEFSDFNGERGTDPDEPMFGPSAWKQAFGAEARHKARIASLTSEEYAARQKRIKDQWDAACEKAAELGQQARQLQKRLTADVHRKRAERFAKLGW